MSVCLQALLKKLPPPAVALEYYKASCARRSILVGRDTLFVPHVRRHQRWNAQSLNTRASTAPQGEDLYMFDDFQTSKQAEPRRPPCECVHCNLC